MDKILIGISILEPSHKFYKSYIDFQKQLLTVEKRPFKVGEHWAHRVPIHLAQQDHAEKAVATKCTHLLLIDDDIYDFKYMDLFRLYNANKDVIAGVMHQSPWPHNLCIYRRLKGDKRLREHAEFDKSPYPLMAIPERERVGVQQVELMPFGFALIKTEIFKDMPKPWFGTGKDKFTDSWFADVVLEAGKQYYAHFDVWLNHRGITRANTKAWHDLGMANGEHLKCYQVDMEKKDKDEYAREFKDRMVKASQEFEKRREKEIEETFI